jgi:D-alanyl-D-alanine carboxypeptidase (penicillin-binding protein 5/6)
LTATEEPSRHRLGRTGVALAVAVGLAAVFVGVQLVRGVPDPRVVSAAPATWRVPGPAPALPWPSAGEAAVLVPGVGTFGSSGSSRPVPIASVTKIMTALIVLHDHPLNPDQAGPSVVASSADAALYQADAAAGDSVAAVSAGEAQNELTLLEELLIPSADNVAVMLADWDAGSESAFVAKMNQMAASLGMSNTHYADPAGLDPATVSTPGDQLRLEQVALANPVLTSVVRQPQMTLPGGQVVDNYNSLVGRDGVIGVKTGSSTDAGGNLVLAADSTVAGRPVQILAVVLAQQGAAPLQTVLSVSQRLLDAARSSISLVTVRPSTRPAAYLARPWGASVPAVATRPLSVLAWPGLEVRLRFTARAPHGESSPQSSMVGVLGASLGSQRPSVPVQTISAAPGPSLGWRLRRL